MYFTRGTWQGRPVFTVSLQKSEGHPVELVWDPFNKAKPIIAAWERAQPVKRVGEFKTLLVYRKTG